MMTMGNWMGPTGVSPMRTKPRCVVLRFASISRMRTMSLFTPRPVENPGDPSDNPAPSGRKVKMMVSAPRLGVPTRGVSGQLLRFFDGLSIRDSASHDVGTWDQYSHGPFGFLLWPYLRSRDRTRL